MKNIKILIISVFLATALSIVSTIPVFADININEKISIDIERYEPEGGWKPGDSKDIKFKISNNTDENIKLNSIYIYKKSLSYDNLATALDEMTNYTMVNFEYNNKQLLEKEITLKELLKNKKILLKEDLLLNKNDNIELLMNIDIDEKMGNQAQSLTSSYSFKIGYKIVTDDNQISDGDNSLDGSTNKPNNQSKPGSTNNNQGGINKLPQTGGFVSATTLIILGLLVIVIGIILDRKSSSKKGGRDDE